VPENLYFGVLATTAFFALIIVAYVVYFAIKYRDEATEKVGAPITGWMPLEIGWALIPFVISISIFVWASIVLFHIQNTSPK
jgi:heme/copper-type cytochrome/quinol oxidase subunit 2